MGNSRFVIRIQNIMFWKHISERLVVGEFMSDCKNPCLTTTVSITEKSVNRQRFPYHSIYLSIPSTVLTTVIKEDSFELMESLNYLGSNLGLWPGLGLFQLFEGSINVILAYKMFDKFKFILAPTKD